MATLTPTDGNLTIEENFNTTDDNLNVLNDAKVGSDISQLPPAQQGNAVKINYFIALPKADFDLIATKDANTVYIVTDAGVYLGNTLISPFTQPC